MKPSVPKPVLPALLLPFLALGAHAQVPAETLSGTAHPEQLADPIQTDHYVKPSRAATTPAAPAYQDSYPATAPTTEPKLLSRESAMPAPVEGTPAPVSTQYAPYAPARSAENSALTPPASASDPADGEVVLSVPTRPHELNRGTLLHARLREKVSTETTAEGAVFTAELMADVGHHGEILLPAGSLLRGRIASVHGGKRISGGAALRLQPETVSLPDGRLYRLDAQVTDVDGTEDLRVNDEGTILLRSHPKATAAVIGGVTATAAVTGAVIGGGVGAAVGAIAGAGVGTTMWLKRDVQETLPAGTDLIFALQQPFSVAPR